MCVSKAHNYDDSACVTAYLVCLADDSGFLQLSIVHSFSRLIEGVDPCPQDLLLNESYYLQCGVGDRGRGKPLLLAGEYHSLS